MGVTPVVGSGRKRVLIDQAGQHIRLDNISGRTTYQAGQRIRLDNKQRAGAKNAAFSTILRYSSNSQAVFEAQTIAFRTAS